jgi:hypothetical protein
MSAAVEVELDLAPEQLIRWLEAELHRAGEHGFRFRATREWRVEEVNFSDGDGLDPEDDLAPHVACGLLELTGPDGAWRIRLEIEDDLGGGAAPDWPPIDGVADGPEDVSLETFAETFAIDGMAGSVILEARDAAARRRAEMLVARILADTHQG